MKGGEPTQPASTDRRGAPTGYPAKMAEMVTCPSPPMVDPLEQISVDTQPWRWSWFIESTISALGRHGSVLDMEEARCPP